MPRRAPTWMALALVGCTQGRETPTIARDPAKSVATASTTSPPAPPPTPPPTPSTFPTPRLECGTDADCDGTSLDDACCWSCGTIVGNRAWIADVNRFCKTKYDGGFGNCPPIDCPFQPIDAKCVAGACTRVPKK